MSHVSRRLNADWNSEAFINLKAAFHCTRAVMEFASLVDSKRRFSSMRIKNKRKPCRSVFLRISLYDSEESAAGGFLQTQTKDNSDAGRSEGTQD